MADSSLNRRMFLRKMVHLTTMAAVGALISGRGAFRAKAARLVITHWGTFRLGDEPVYLPPIAIRSAMEREGPVDRFVDLNHGQTTFL